MAEIPDDTFSLLDQYRAGSPDALDAIMRRQYPRVERIVRIRLAARQGAPVDVADIVQRTMIRAIENLDNFEVREDARMIHWLARVAEREILSHDRHQFAARRDQHREVPIAVITDSTSAPGAPLPVASDTSPPQAAARNEERQALDVCIAQLPTDQREVILLRDYAGAGWEFIAGELDRPSADAARKFHDRARANLAERLRLVLDSDSSAGE